MLRVVVGEFDQRDVLCPLSLVSGDVVPQIRLQNLDCTLALSIDLSVVGGTKIQQSAQSLENVIPNFVEKSVVQIRNYIFGHPMDSKDVVNEEFDNIHDVYCFVGWYKMRHFADPEDNHQYCVESVGFGKICAQVNAQIFPRSVRNR